MCCTSFSPPSAKFSCSKSYLGLDFFFAGCYYQNSSLNQIVEHSRFLQSHLLRNQYSVTHQRARPVTRIRLGIKIIDKCDINRELNPTHYSSAFFLHDGEVIGSRFFEFHALEGKPCAEHAIRSIVAVLVRNDGLFIADRHVTGVCHIRNFTLCASISI